MTQLSESPKAITITPLREIHLTTLRFLTAMHDQATELVQLAETDTPGCLQLKSSIETVREVRDHMASDPDSSEALTILHEVVAGLLIASQHPAYATENGFIESALEAIGAAASPAVCELVTTAGGPFTRKVLAISVLREIYPYVPATTQTAIESAVDTASQQAITSKKLTAALAEAKTALKAVPAATTVGHAESAVPQLTPSLEAASAI